MLFCCLLQFDGILEQNDQLNGIKDRAYIDTRNKQGRGFACVLGG